MFGSIRLNILPFKHRQKLMLAKSKKGVALSFVKLFEVEHVAIKSDSLLNVPHFDCDVITSVNLNRHAITNIRFSLPARGYFMKFLNKLRDLIGCGIEREMSRVEHVNFRLRHIAAISFGLAKFE